MKDEMKTPKGLAVGILEDMKKPEPKAEPKAEIVEAKEEPEVKAEPKKTTKKPAGRKPAKK